MRFSSISLIAATLASIVGGAIAAPGPLHARALGQVNAFERELEGDKLFKRWHQEAHMQASGALSSAIKASKTATIEAGATADFLIAHSKHGEAQPWEKVEAQQKKLTKAQFQQQRHHDAHAGSPFPTKFSESIPDDIATAQTQTTHSYQVAAAAVHARRHEYKGVPLITS